MANIAAVIVVIITVIIITASFILCSFVDCQDSGYCENHYRQPYPYRKRLILCYRRDHRYCYEYLGYIKQIFAKLFECLFFHTISFGLLNCSTKSALSFWKCCNITLVSVRERVSELLEKGERASAPYINIGVTLRHSKLIRSISSIPLELKFFT